MPISFYYGIALALVLAYLLAWTPIGRSMVFVGANREVARLAGIRVQRIRFGAYVAGGLLAGLAGADPGRHRRRLRLRDLGELPAAGPGRRLPRHRRRAAGHVQPDRHDGRHLLPHDRHLRAAAARLPGWIQNVFYGAGLVVAVTLAKVVRDRSRTD